MAEFTMLIGLPGSGKSKMAEALKARGNLSGRDVVVISSDEIRRELYGDATIQDNPEMIFREMHRRTKEALLLGKDVVYDATNIARKHRMHTVRALPICKKTAIVVWARFGDCVNRDLERGRTVGEYVIKRMVRHFQIPYYDEGWDAIKITPTSPLYTSADYAGWMDCEHDNPHHKNTVKEHTDKVVSEVASIDYEDIPKGNGMNLVLAAQLHDIGKKFTKRFANSKGEKTDIAHYYDHHNVGAYFCLGYEPLSSTNDGVVNKLLVAWLVNNHMEPFFNSKYYKSLVGCTERKLLDLLHQCDVRGA